MAYINEFVKTIKTYDVTMTEEEMMIVYKLLAEDKPTEGRKYGHATSFTLYENFRDALGELP